MTAGSQTHRSRSSGSGRGPGGRGAGLDREQIVDRAIALMDAEGAGALTIRRLAGDLGVESAALYWHFASKGDLCRAVVDAVGARLRVATVTTGTARERLQYHFTAIRDHWRRHPSVLELSRQYPPSAGGDVARAGLALVNELGIGPSDTLECYRSLSWTVTGFVILEQNLESSVHHRRVGRTRWVLTIDDDASTDRAFDTDELFRTTLTMALDGLERRPERRRSRGQG
jgi:AcrR family transcriptional regulator